MTKTLTIKIEGQDEQTIKVRSSKQAIEIVTNLTGLSAHCWIKGIMFLDSYFSVKLNTRVIAHVR